MATDRAIPTATGDSGMRWFVAGDLGELEGHLRYHYSRRLFAVETVNGTLLVGVAVPEDVTEPGGERVLRFRNEAFYEAPLHRFGGGVVTRLPPRDMLHFLHREAMATAGPDHPCTPDRYRHGTAGEVIRDGD